MKKNLVLLLCFLLVLIVSGCKSSTNLLDIKSNEIQSLQYEITIHKNLFPNPLLPSNSKDKLIIQKVVNWLNNAKSDGYDDQVPSQSIPPNSLTINLKNGSTINLSPGIYDVVYASSSIVPGKTLRLHSLELDMWLAGGWRKDISTKTK
jgi:hypothetical protein